MINIERTPKKFNETSDFFWKKLSCTIETVLYLLSNLAFILLIADSMSSCSPVHTTP